MQNNDQQTSFHQQGMKQRGASLSPRAASLFSWMNLRVVGMPFHNFCCSFCVAALSLPLLTGCNMNDPMIQEMDGAYAVKESNEDVTRVVQKYFPPGMQMEDAFKLLHQLKEQGFEIGEYRHEGVRKWPEGGELLIYRDEASKRAYQPPGSMVDYTARKRYEHRLFVFEKHAFITIRTDGEKIISTEGRIWPQTNVP